MENICQSRARGPRSFGKSAATPPADSTESSFLYSEAEMKVKKEKIDVVRQNIVVEVEVKEVIKLMAERQLMELLRAQGLQLEGPENNYLSSEDANLHMEVSMLATKKQYDPELAKIAEPTKLKDHKLKEAERKIMKLQEDLAASERARGNAQAELDARKSNFGTIITGNIDDGGQEAYDVVSQAVDTFDRDQAEFSGLHGSSAASPGSGHKSSTPTLDPGRGHELSTPTLNNGTGHESATPTLDPGTGHASSTPTLDPGTGHESSTPTLDPGAGHESSTLTLDPGRGHEFSIPTLDSSKRYPITHDTRTICVTKKSLEPTENMIQYYRLHNKKGIIFVDLDNCSSLFHGKNQEEEDKILITMTNCPEIFFFVVFNDETKLLERRVVQYLKDRNRIHIEKVGNGKNAADLRIVSRAIVVGLHLPSMPLNIISGDESFRSISDLPSINFIMDLFLPNKIQITEPSEFPNLFKSSSNDESIPEVKLIKRFYINDQDVVENIESNDVFIGLFCTKGFNIKQKKLFKDICDRIKVFPHCRKQKDGADFQLQAVSLILNFYLEENIPFTVYSSEEIVSEIKAFCPSRSIKVGTS